MTFTIPDLKRAVAAGVLDSAAAERLVAFLAADARNVVGVAGAPARTRFDLVHLLWYCGALLIIGAMGLFSTTAFMALGGKALALVALVYGALFGLAGDYLWRKKGLTTPGGLLIAIAVSMAALLVYGLQEGYGLWGGDKTPGSMRDFYHFVKSGWLPMEIATIAAAGLALTRYRFPFLVAIIAFLLWFMSMDIAAWIVGDAKLDWEVRRKVSILFGLCMIGLAWLVDMRQRKADFAYWLHIFGIIVFWGGITFKASGTPLDKVLYGLLSVGLLMFSVFMNRRVYSIFGGLGLLVLLGDLSRHLFVNSVVFPFVLTGIGIAVIALGLWVLKYRATLEAAAERLIPAGLRSLRPPHALNDMGV